MQIWGSVPDWLMLISTVIYVAATIKIFKANKISADATKKQLDESKRQFDEQKKQFEEQIKLAKEELEESKRQYAETQRLQLMPYLQLYSTKRSVETEIELLIKSNEVNGAHYSINFVIQNIGLGTAKEIKYKWENLTDTYDRGAFLVNGLCAGSEFSFRITFTSPHNPKDNYKCKVILDYKDLLNNQYCQSIDFIFVCDNFNSMILKEYFVNSPLLLDGAEKNAR